MEREIGIIGMKSLASGCIMETGVSPREAISYALSMPIHTLISGMDSLEVLKENIETARRWHPLGEEKRNQMLERIAQSARDGHLEHYKTG
jgi:predicted aldo/keto reductase-like oxidoreductase